MRQRGSYSVGHHRPSRTVWRWIAVVLGGLTLGVVVMAIPQSLISGRPTLWTPSVLSAFRQRSALPVAAAQPQTQPGDEAFSEPSPNHPPLVTESVTPFPSPTSTPVPAREPPVDIEPYLRDMTTAQKVGQLLLYGFAGTTLDSVLPLIDTYQPGGIVFVSNATTPERATTLTHGIQERARAVGQHIPVLLAIDHESGFVQRVKGDATWFPGSLILGATWSPELAYLQGSIQGQELRAWGFNMNFAPVLDVDNYTDNPIIGAFDRSLGDSPAEVGRLGVAYIRGLQDAGIMATAKHYPGHGSTSVDSHVSLPTVRHDRSDVDDLDLPPFVAAARQDVAAVMVGHLSFPLVDPSLPTSLSPTFIDDLLRHELNYDGLVMTDSLGMGAITERYTMSGAALRSFLAGSDLVLVVGPPEAQRATFQTILAAVQDGRISQERLDRSVRRILRTKAAYGLFGEGPPLASKEEIADDHPAALQRVADGAITLLRNDDRRIPTRLPSGAHVLVVRPNSLPRTGDNPDLRAAIRAERPDLDVVELQFSLTGDNSQVFARTLAMAPAADLVVVATVSVGPWQQSLIAELAAANRDPIVIGLDTPNDILRLPQARTYLAAYRGYEVMVRAAARALLADTPPRGRLPYRISDEYPTGFGLGATR